MSVFMKVYKYCWTYPVSEIGAHLSITMVFEHRKIDTECWWLNKRGSFHSNERLLQHNLPIHVSFKETFVFSY